MVGKQKKYNYIINNISYIFSIPENIKHWNLFFITIA
jgi:hypothetical protein